MKSRRWLSSAAFVLLVSASVSAHGQASRYVQRINRANNPNVRVNTPPPSNPRGRANTLPPTATPPPAPTPALPQFGNQIAARAAVERPPSLSKDEVEKKRLEWQIEHAEKGSPSAQYDLGMRYLKGDGVGQDEETGRGWLEKAARQGNSLAYEKLKDTDYLTEKRDETGRVLRSKTARQQFMKQTEHPNGRPGYVITHIVPIEEGGADVPGNMKWLPIDEAKTKEKWR